MLCREIIAACSDIRTKHGIAQCGLIVEFLGAFAELLKAIVNFVMCLSVILFAWNNWMDCHDVGYLSTLRK